MANKKNFSDELFERYLNSQNLKFVYEKDCAEREKKGKKTPDYVVYNDSQQIVFDVKEFESNVNSSDYYYSSTIEQDLKTIREKINKARVQFKDFKDFPCSLVLYSFDYDIKTNLCTPFLMYGAMYGDVGWTYPNHSLINSFDKKFKNPEFTENGKMFHSKSRKAQNTSFSSLIVLREFGQQVGTIVYENFFAKNPLPKNLFCGNYDVRYGKEENTIRRIFAGKEITPNGYLNKDSEFVIQFK